MKILKQLSKTISKLTLILFFCTCSFANEPIDIWKIEKKDVEYIELEIDRLNKDLPELKNFVIPGGHKTSSYSHVCRSICRRAERKISELNNKSSVDSNILAYVNRLSDFFFVLSRFLKHSDNVSESHW